MPFTYRTNVIRCKIMKKLKLIFVLVKYKVELSFYSEIHISPKVILTQKTEQKACGRFESSNETL